MTLFKETGTNIPASHFYAFKACNNGGSYWYKQDFYKLKNQLLDLFGHEDGHDLQVIVKKCHSCAGTGMYWQDEECYRCGGTGIFDIKHVVLKRYRLNGEVFHRPLGRLTHNRTQIEIFDGYDTHGYTKFKYEPFTGKFTDTIHGIILHKPGELNPNWAYLYLLFNYDKIAFLSAIKEMVARAQTNTKYKLRTLLKQYSPLQAMHRYFEVKPQHTEPIDDLPF